MILLNLVLFYILVQSTASRCDIPRFGKLFRRSVILSDLVSFHILVRITESWCDLRIFGWRYFSLCKFLFLHVFFHFYTCISNILHTEEKLLL